MTLPGSAADVLAGHVLFEIEAIDRMYLNLYQPSSTVAVFQSVIALPLSVMRCSQVPGYIASPPFVRRG